MTSSNHPPSHPLCSLLHFLACAATRLRLRQKAGNSGISTCRSGCQILRSLRSIVSLVSERRHGFISPLYLGERGVGGRRGTASKGSRSLPGEITPQNLVQAQIWDVMRGAV